MYTYFICKSVCEHLRVLFFSSFNNEFTRIDIIFQFQLTHVFFCAPLIVLYTIHVHLLCQMLCRFIRLFFHCCLFCIHKTIEFIWNSVCRCLFVFSSILSFPLAKVWFCEIHSSKQHNINNSNGLKCVYFQVRLAKIFETMNCPKSTAQYFQTNKSACCLIRFLKL